MVLNISHHICIKYKKSDMKNLIKYCAATLLLILSSCGTSNTMPKVDVSSLLQQGEFTFMAEKAHPTNADVINVLNSLPNSSSARVLDLDYGYSLRVEKSEITAELPYFGRSYTPSYDTSKSAYRFKTKEFGITKKEGKKGSTVYTIIPQDRSGVQRLILEVFPQGRAYLSIDSNDRQPISYSGYVTKNLEKK